MGAKIKTITNFFTIMSGLLEARVKSLYLRENIHDFPCFNRANIHCTYILKYIALGLGGLNKVIFKYLMT